MYQLADKNKVMSLFHKGESVSQIRLKSNVSKSTLYRWKAEYDTTGEIMRYIRKGQLDRAKQIISQFQGEHRKTNELLTSKVIGQFIRFGYLDEARELAEDLLKQYQKNISVRSQLVTIAKQKEDWEEVERLSREILALDSNDLPSRSQLIGIAKQKGDWEEVERLSRERLALDPSNKIAKKQLKTSQKMQKWSKRVEERKGTSQPMQEKPDSNCQSPQHSIQVIRNQIQAGTFLLDDIEARKREMREIGIDEVQINLLLAEAYERQNLPKQTKAYLKKALQGAQEPKLQKAIKALLETAQTKKKKPSHINPWDNITRTRCRNNVGQTTKIQKEPDEK